MRKLSKKTCQVVDFAVQGDHGVKLKESERRNKYQNHATKKNHLDMKVTVIPMIIGALGTIPKEMINGLEDLEIRERVETIQTTGLMRSVRILTRVLES